MGGRKKILGDRPDPKRLGQESVSVCAPARSLAPRSKYGFLGTLRSYTKKHTARIPEQKTKNMPREGAWYSPLCAGDVSCGQAIGGYAKRRRHQLQSRTTEVMTRGGGPAHFACSSKFCSLRRPDTGDPSRKAAHPPPPQPRPPLQPRPPPVARADGSGMKSVVHNANPPNL